MTNIYNKAIKFPNGTLIGNWFEEDELRNKTGEGRTILRGHFKKKNFDLSEPLNDSAPKDDTFKRVIGEKEPTKDYFLYSKVYGTFEHPEMKYLHPPLRAKKEQALFKEFVQKSVDLTKEIEDQNDDVRGLTSTYRSVHVQQPLAENIGRRLMFTQDKDPIPQDGPDKLFMAQHKMSKFPTVLSPTEASGYIDRYVPYYKDKEITYWSTNLANSNVYHSFCLGQNSFARSNAFTQPIHATRGTTQYQGNNQNLKSSQYIYMNDHDAEFYEKYKADVEKTEMVNDISPEIKSCLLGSCSKKGWVGLRGLKIYLRSCSKNGSELIEKSNFKFYTANCGVVFSDYQIEFIFNRFDKKKSSKVNYIEVLNSYRNVSDNRKEEIENFLYQVLNPGTKFISFEHLLKICDMNFHPEVTKFLKTAKDCYEEYLISWDSLKEDNLITENNFREFFYDVSSCIPNDEDFTQCLKSCGYK